METVTFDSDGTRCEGWWLPATTDDLATDAGRPCVVMAHGFATTRDTGLLPYAERFADLGCEVLVFDYRGFGGSDTPEGGHRQDVDHKRHREDYHAAIAYARGRFGVDPTRVALWGTSYSGGHVVAVAAEDREVAAVVSQGAAMDGRTALTAGRGRRGDDGDETDDAPGAPADETDDDGDAPTGLRGRLRQARAGRRSKGAALRKALLADTSRRVRRGDPVTIPVVGDPADGAMFSGPDAEAFRALTGPRFVNEVTVRSLARIPFNRPVAVADKVACPALLVVAERDEVCPPASVDEVAELMRAAGTDVSVVRLDSTHFPLYTGEVLEQVLDAETDFLRRVLAVAAS